MLPFQKKNKSPGDFFFNPFTVCSSCKREILLFIRLFLKKEQKTIRLQTDLTD